MSLPLTDMETAKYTAIIDAILGTADLETITRKKVRQGLEKALGGRPLDDQKKAIRALIEQRFDAIARSNNNMPTPPSAPATSDEAVRPPKRERSETNGHVKEEDEDEEEEDVDGEIEVSFDEQPAKKKQKTVVDEDARLAALLQAQENQLARARTTRGGSTGKPSKPKKKAPKKKSAAKVKDDDSDVDSTDGSGATKEKKRGSGGGFQKRWNLSYALGEVCGETQLSRPQVVKKLWEHIKANELQDPNDKRQIRCDEKMQAVFKQTTVNMFSMNKLLGNHLYPVEE